MTALFSACLLCFPKVAAGLLASQFCILYSEAVTVRKMRVETGSAACVNRKLSSPLASVILLLYHGLD